MTRFGLATVLVAGLLAPALSAQSPAAKGRCNIYLMGHSMGGGGTWHLGIKYPDLWAALAPIAPAAFRPAGDVAKVRHVPVILIQGDADNLCPVGTARKWAAEMKELGMTYRYVEVAGGDHVSVAWKNMPEVFAFFDRHRRPAK